MNLLRDGAFRALLFCQTVVFLLLTSGCEGDSDLVIPPHPINATVGEDIVIPCHLDPVVDATDLTIIWWKFDRDPKFVFVWKDGEEMKSKPHALFTGRTSVSSSNLKHGDVSLKLQSVKRSDQGKYACHIETLMREAFIDLVVVQ
ncbi:butyrophilin subfamily 3 member A2-like [Xyrichtys novacula]|uniref:Butyrophilin subfamily 3 member A2-like n=1 Tax=Xyrichtys novacula TaxID=13765 RepID=A0AAV1EHQ8_XYRNO|nr:butyrophilin subfamily 3 member A2-like [Xyrichtys novacula]